MTDQSGGVRDLGWSPAEKRAARQAFEAAWARECAAIRREAGAMLERSSDPADVWRVHDYLSEKRREVDGKYDYRYSVLVSVLGRLVAEGWITEEELARLAPERREQIRSRAAMWQGLDP
jgi:Photoprotection regulator fluorescence recovery protein